MAEFPDPPTFGPRELPRAAVEFDPFRPGSPAAGTTTFDWHEYVRILRRRRWPAVTVLLLSVVFAGVHAYTRVPSYQARVRLIIESARTNVTGLQDPLEGERQTAADFQTQFTILQSRSLARRTMEALGIWDVPAPAAPAVSPPARGSWQAAVHTARETIAWLAAGAPASQPVRPELQESAVETAKIDGFMAGVRVVPIPNSRLVDVFYESTDPVAAARYSNALVEHFIKQNLQLTLTASQEVTTWLADRLSEQRQALDVSEQALQDYRERNGVVTATDQAVIGVQKLTDLTTAFTRAKTERIEKEALFQQLQAVERDRSGLDSFPAVLANTFVQQLKSEVVSRQTELQQVSERLGDRHPTRIKAREAVEMAQARLDAEVQKVVQSVRREYAAARAAEASLGQALEAQRRETLSTNRSDVEFAVLQRDAESNRQIYDSLLQRLNEFTITRERRTSNIRVVDPAEVPQTPVGVGARRDLRYGAFGGLLLAVCVVFLLEYLDNRIKTPREIKQDLGLAFLGLVPIADRMDDHQRPLLTAASPRFGESFRALRTNVRLSIPAGEGARTLVVTSANAGEGKTLVASNLAIALAQTDQRVLLIDADLRRARQHEVFGLHQIPGLSNLLVGDAAAVDAIVRTSIGHLHVLTGGTAPPNPSELLDSKRFETFIAQVSRHYDWTIIDSPPVLPVTDAIILAQRASGVIMVTAADLTPIGAARAALDHLRSARARVIGAVLNRADLDHHAYYYGHYYQSDYESYYKQPAATA